jgi:hydrogen peroxide-dependent heme synthase
MAQPTLAPLVLDGWFVLHQFFRLDPVVHEGPDDPDGEPNARGLQDRIRAFAELLAGWERPDDGGWSGAFRIVGGGTDLMLTHFRNSLEGLGEAERAVQRSPLAVDLHPTGDYVSVVELGLYSMTHALIERAEKEGVAHGTPEWQAMVEEVLAEERAKRYVQARLRPTQPEQMPYVCFYPMDKRRNVGQNWYTLPLEERAALMAEHGNTGRRYAGRISQIISGSVGLDDWEWAVTLFASDPLDLKALVTEMRYDEVSALYAEFGSFWIGYRIPSERLVEQLTG